MRIQLLNTNPIIESVETLRGTQSQNQQNQLELRSETLIPVVTRHPSSAWNPWTKKT
jgi:hypothetical protein